MEADLAANAVKTAGALILILGVIVCLFYVLKKARFGPASAAGMSRMRILSSLSIAPKRSIALVEIRDEWLVVGVGTDSVTLLTRMNRPEEPAAAEATGTPAAQSFRTLLGNMTGRAPRGEE
ncbi:MAG: flagellar biosynthetic protein FliO [Deltaproteobacteria bacterium]|nr:flagellar biosynthetic protein FliO [Deltaproteobacteria bacterium]